MNINCSYCRHKLEIRQGARRYWTACPVCGAEGPKMDTEERAWGALDIVARGHAEVATDTDAGCKIPLPVKRDEKGPVSEKSVKELLAKVQEELSELQFAMWGANIDTDYIAIPPWPVSKHDSEIIALFDEWADTITALTTLADALGIDADERAAAIARCNERNADRGRL